MAIHLLPDVPMYYFSYYIVLHFLIATSYFIYLRYHTAFLFQVSL